MQERERDINFLNDFDTWAQLSGGGLLLMMLPIMLEQDFLTGRAIRPVELKIWGNSNILFMLL